VSALRPMLQLLAADEVERIVEDAFQVLARVGFSVENNDALELMRAAGVRLVEARAFVTETEVRSALATVPSRVVVHDRDGQPALDLGELNVHFDPGSAALHFLDPGTRRQRAPVTQDLVHLGWVTQACRNLAGQSTALVPSDVPEQLADRWRLRVALEHCEKPIITGTFRRDGFAPMRAMLAAVRGGEQALAERPLAIFDCCPSPPLRWSDLTCQALIDCARAGIPAELVSMPLAGATAPVTLREMVVQHCAESLSGIVIHQLAKAGAPIVYGGSPSAFDMRHGTTPMGAIETMMVDIAYAQVGRHLRLPTHAYMGPSDAKIADYQAGSESALGLVLAALGGVNMVSGAGLLDFENCQSLEKIVLDNELCGMALRATRGIGTGSAGEALELLGQLVAQGSLLGHRHTRTHFRSELLIPGIVIDRSTYGEWEKAGSAEAFERAHAEVERILARGNPVPLPDDLRAELTAIITADARQLGITELPPV
jgi:trimethylamine--corrinoid protein Co-methyltransferase